MQEVGGPNLLVEFHRDFGLFHHPVWAAKYSPPGRDILLARDVSGVAVGCVAVRTLDFNSASELKRLYVSPIKRDSGLGVRLLKAILDRVIAPGYSEI